MMADGTLSKTVTARTHRAEHSHRGTSASLLYQSGTVVPADHRVIGPTRRSRRCRPALPSAPSRRRRGSAEGDTAPRLRQEAASTSRS